MCSAADNFGVPRNSAGGTSAAGTGYFYYACRLPSKNLREPPAYGQLKFLGASNYLNTNIHAFIV